MPHTDTKYSPAPTSMKKTRSWSFHSVCRGWWDDWWLPEVFSALTGILAIFGIFIVLKAYDNGPIPNWGSVLNTTITLNTVLSILGTVVKMSLMMPVIECISQLKWPWFDQGRPLIDLNIFDQASRGPLGSIKLIWRLKAIHLGALGGILVLFAVVMDPFVQQTVVYTPRNILVTSANPSVKRVNDLNTLSVSKQPTASMTLSEFANHILPWTNSIFDGVLTWNTSRVNFDSVKPVCLSRNCTWDAYPSLGVCASPSDVTSRLKVSSDGSIATLPSNKSLAGHDAYMRVEATWDLHQMGKSGEFILNDSTSTAFINTRNPIYHGSAIYVPNPLQTFVNPNQRR